MNELVCELCKRSGVPKLTEHHLIPRENGGRDKETVLLCEDCHKQIHALYTNKELAMRLNTLEKLKCDYKIEKYLNVDLTDEEKLYLTLHVQRVTQR